MNNNEIIRCMANDPYISSTFYGVYPADVHLDCSKPGLYVLNTDNSGLPGTHWLLLLITNDCDGYIFDSLGFRGAYVDRIIDSIHGLAHTVIKTPLQSENTQLCGGYSLYFARKLAENCSIRSMLHPFNLNRLTNDCFVQNYLWSVFGVFLSLVGD